MKETQGENREDEEARLTGGRLLVTAPNQEICVMVSIMAGNSEKEL